MSSSSAIPFVVGQWVRGERFYGRDDQIAEILGGHRNAIWLLGTRRIGKTSLLKQLEHVSAGGEHGFFPLFWDFQGADNLEELSANFNDSLLDAEDRLAELGIAVAEVERDDLFASLGRLRRRLRAMGRKALLLCDEVEELIRLKDEDPSVLRKLRRAVQSQEGIRAVLASSIRLWALAEERDDTSPFLHGFIPPLYIRPLSYEEAGALIRQTHLDPELRPLISDADVETIRRRCDNHPYLTQLVAKRFLELGDLEEACEQVAADGMVRHFFAVDFAMLSTLERQVLRFISAQTHADSRSLQHRLPADSGSLASGLQRLENLGFIRRDEERRFVLSSFFFRRWLAEASQADPTVSHSTRAIDDAPTETALAYQARVETIDGRYELLEEVGKGASGVVYRAYDTLLKTPVALKLLRSEYAASQRALDRVRQEILLSRDIGHPNIVRVYHLGTSGMKVYITMQWIEGPNLAEVIAAEAPLAVETAVAVVTKLASALAAAHRHQILHRDVKPSNVLLDHQREPFLADFGLARLIDSPGITSQGLFLGTPYYASPEQAELRPLDERSDLYALGLVLFEMVTGRRPFEAESSRELLEMRRTLEPPDPRQLAPALPSGFAEVIRRCLARDPDDRYADAESLASALRAAGDFG